DLHLRATEHEQALQRQMDLTAKKCGLGVGRYRFDAGGNANKTATEVISSKSDLYQSLKRHEKTFETAIVGMVQALCWLSGGKADAEVQVAFDDSIIEDVNATIQRNTLLVNSGLRSKVDAIMAIEQCEESVAKRKLAAIQAENGLGAELGGEMGGGEA
ncbi:MAG: phage portal protein, partial [Clostridia bacterium]